MTVVSLDAYRQKRCAECGKPMDGVEHMSGEPSYCGDRCARRAQPDLVVIGAGKGSAAG